MKAALWNLIRFCWLNTLFLKIFMNKFAVSVSIRVRSIPLWKNLLFFSILFCIFRTSFNNVVLIAFIEPFDFVRFRRPIHWTQILFYTSFSISLRHIQTENGEAEKNRNNSNSILQHFSHSFATRTQFIVFIWCRHTRVFIYTKTIFKV